MTDHFVFKCPRCGRHCVKIIRGGRFLKFVFKCTYCGKGTRLKKKTEFGLCVAYKGPYESGSVAAEVCRQLNQPKGQNI